MIGEGIEGGDSSMTEEIAVNVSGGGGGTVEE